MTTKDDSRRIKSTSDMEIRNGSGKKDNSELKTLFKKKGN